MLLFAMSYESPGFSWGERHLLFIRLGLIFSDICALCEIVYVPFLFRSSMYPGSGSLGSLHC